MVIRRRVLTARECGALLTEATEEWRPEEGSDDGHSDRRVTIWQVERSFSDPVIRKLNQQFQRSNAWDFELTGILDSLWVMRYPLYGYSAKHSDLDLSAPWHPKITAIIPLVHDSAWDGGGLWIDDEEVCGLRRGDCVLFPSFVPHEVTKVCRGERWVMAAWASGPPLR